jgi:hypothetical protein
VVETPSTSPVVGSLTLFDTAVFLGGDLDTGRGCTTPAAQDDLSLMDVLIFREPESPIIPRETCLRVSPVTGSAVSLAASDVEPVLRDCR